MESGFSSKESWTILSPIEQSIKTKIEAIGTPLKRWDINIYRGILTGYNEAFIIDSKTRDKLIKQDPKSAEIIRPILRGRDIRRYSYDFDDKYLIATIPSKKYNIDNYSAVKSFLEGFKPKLKQTGEFLTDKEIKEVMVHAKANNITLNEKDLKTARKRTTNRWFETQDSISYWDDFSKQKIIWKIIGNQMAFAIDSNAYIVNNACYILTGPSLEYLLSVLNSKIITWYSFITNMNKTGVGDVQVGGQNVNLFPVPLIPETAQKPFVDLVMAILKRKAVDEDTTALEMKIERLVNELYTLTAEEVDFLNSL